MIRRAAAADRFTGKNGSSLDIVAPTGLTAPRLVVIGTGKERDLKTRDIVKLGGIAMGKVPVVAADATIFAELASGALKNEQVADLALGVRLRAYTFDRYKTKRKEGRRAAEEGRNAVRCANPRWRREGVVAHDGHRRRRCPGARSHQRAGECALSGGVRAPRPALSKLGVTVEVLDVPR